MVDFQKKVFVDRDEALYLSKTPRLQLALPVDTSVPGCKTLLAIIFFIVPVQFGRFFYLLSHPYLLFRQNKTFFHHEFSLFESH